MDLNAIALVVLCDDIGQRYTLACTIGIHVHAHTAVGFYAHAADADNAAAGDLQSIAVILVEDIGAVDGHTPPSAGSIIDINSGIVNVIKQACTLLSVTWPMEVI